MSDTTYPPALPQAVLFADICGSTRLYEILGDARALGAINACLSLLQVIGLSFGGRAVKTIGDEIMVAFPSAEAAMQAAREMQLALTAQAPVDNTRMAIRIGFHFGPVLSRDGDMFGDTVNLAARLAEIARANQIISSAATVATLPPHMRGGTRYLDELPVRGKTADIGVYEIVWQDSSEMTIMPARSQSPRSERGGLRLRHRGQELLMGAGLAVVVLGRDTGADVVIQDRAASRIHAKIELRRNKFVFIDQSANGSFISIRGEKEILLRREELLLRGSGVICCGVARNATSEFVEFFCQT